MRRVRCRRAPCFACALVLGLVTSACAPAGREAEAPTAANIFIVDATGRELSLSGPASRIISLVPSATQTLRALGADTLLVGRTDFDTQDWLAHLPSVGGGLEPKLEEILSLRPDLVILFAGEQDARTPGRLDDLGIPHIAIRPDGIADVYASAILLGAVTGRAQAASDLVDEIQAGLEELRLAVAPLPRLRVLYVLGGSPPWVAGPGTFIDEILALVGGDNVFADLNTLYGSVSPEEIRARRIDVVLVSDVSQFDPSLSPAARIAEVGSALEIPGPGVVDAAWRVAERMHGTTLR